MCPHFRNLINSNSAHHVTAMFQSNLTHSQMCVITLNRIYFFLVLSNILFSLLKYFCHMNGLQRTLKHVHSQSRLFPILIIYKIQQNGKEGGKRLSKGTGDHHQFRQHNNQDNHQLNQIWLE